MLASLRSPWRPVRGRRAVCGEEWRRVVRQTFHQPARGARRAAVEGLPALEEPFADGEALRPVPLRHGPGQEEEPLAHRAPRPVPVGRRRTVVGPWHRVEPRDRLEDAVEHSGRHDGVLPGSLPRDELVGEVRHQDRDPVAVGRDADVRRHERFDESELAARDQAFAQGEVIRRPGDPVDRPGGSFQDEPLVVAPQGRQGGTGPTVVGERRLGDPGQAGRFEELADRARGSSPSRAPGRRLRRPGRRRGRRRASPDSCGSGRRPAARSSRRSPRRGPRLRRCR